MHRTEGEDFNPDVYGDASNKPGHQTANPPSQFATRFTSSLANALQEEIANVVEHAGLTLNTSATDEANWDQLKEALFASGAISSPALSATVKGKYQKKTSSDVTTTGIISALTFVLEENSVYQFNFSADVLTGASGGGAFVDIQNADGTLLFKRLRPSDSDGISTLEMSQTATFKTGLTLNSRTIEVEVFSITVGSTLRNSTLQIKSEPLLSETASW